MEKMKAVLMYGPNDIRVEFIEKPKFDDDGMLIKIEAVGLCGSDIRNFSTNSHFGEYPCILGHEQAGTVAEIGKNFTRNFKLGDRVYISPISKKGPDGNWDPASGGFAEYLKLSNWDLDHCNVLKMPDGIAFEDVTLTEPLSAVYACLETVNVKIGQTVAVLGAGPIGCMHSELSKIRGADRVIMVDLAENRLNMSLKFGVDHTIDASKLDPIKKVSDITRGRFADHVICANSSTQAQQQAVYLCGKGGVVSLFGGVPKGSKVEIDTNRVHYAGMWLYGHTGYSAQDNIKAFELICSNRLNAKNYISSVMPLDKIKEAIELVKSNKVLKIIFTP